MNNIDHSIVQQATCKFKMAKCNWNVVKLDNICNVWGWKRTKILLVVACQLHYGYRLYMYVFFICIIIAKYTCILLINCIIVVKNFYLHLEYEH
jgi:hypothetical protein